MARLFIAVIAIQGASKMHRTEVDLVPVGCVLDELSRIDGLPRDATAPILILDEAEPLHAAGRLRAIQSLPGTYAHVSAMALAGKMRARCAIVLPPTKPPFRFGLLSRGLRGEPSADAACQRISD